MKEAIEKAIEGGWGKGYIFNIAPQDGQLGFIEPKTREELEEWNEKHPNLAGKIVIHNLTRELFNEALLDPTFWQAFGKAMGWKDRKSECCQANVSHYPKDTPQPNGSIIPIWYDWCKACGEKCKVIEHRNHIHHWHRFIDHLAEGKDAESFFKELLK